MKKQDKNAIDIHNVCVDYKILSCTYVKKDLLKRKGRDEIVRAVRDVSFSVKEGRILGMVGKNGSGKSTLLHAIAGIFSANSGTIDLHGHTVSLMALGVGFVNNLSGRDNIILSGMLLGFSKKQIEERMQEIIAFSEMGEFIDRPVRTYSSGMHARLSFAITAVLETDIMLIDEVLSVGDERFKKKSLAKMKELIRDENRTVIIVSHNISTLKELCDSVLWLHDGQVREMGDPDTVLEHYVEFMARQI